MKSNNLKVTKYMTALALTATLSLTSLTACGNKQLVDFNKSFNVAVETNGDNVSVVGIKTYSDYSGTQIQFVTNDNLRVLSSTHQTQLVKAENQMAVDNYALSLSGNKVENVIAYANLQEGAEISFSVDAWNKDIIDMHYTYKKAIILTDNIATIVTLDTWRDYEDDDKIQIKLSDGTCILTDTDKVKLINDDKANEKSLENYAITLVGSKENVVYYDAEKVNKK